MGETEQSSSECLHFAMNFNQLSQLQSQVGWLKTKVERGIDYMQKMSQRNSLLRREEVCLKSLFMKRWTNHLGVLVGQEY